MAYAFQVDTDGTLTTNLVSYYKLDSNSNDVWSTNNGTDTSVSYVTGKVNNAASFNGSSSKVDISGTTGLPTGAGARSMAFWVYMTSAPAGTYYIIGWGGSGTDLDFRFFIQATIVGIDQYNHSGTISNTFATDTWIHVIVTYPGSGSTYTIYKNGSSIGTLNTTATPNTSAANFSIGYRASNTDGYLTGYVDEAGIWSKVLSAQEITDLYNGGSGQTMVTATSTGNFFMVM